MNSYERTALLKETRLTPVNEIPGGGFLGATESIYLPVLRKFIDSGHAIVKLEMDWPEGATNGECQGVVVGLRTQAKHKELPVVVSSRSGDIYLQRREVPVQQVSREKGRGSGRSASAHKSSAWDQEAEQALALIRKEGETTLAQMEGKPLTCTVSESLKQAMQEEAAILDTFHGGKK